MHLLLYHYWVFLFLLAYLNLYHWHSLYVVLYDECIFGAWLPRNAIVQREEAPKGL
jgi:hypothetical protein